MSWCFLCGHFIDQTSLSSFFRYISAPTSSSRGPFTTSMSCRPSPTRPVRRPSSDNIDFDYDEFRAERDAALIRYFVQLLWECVKTLLPSDVFHVVRDYTRTFAHTEFYISYPDLYLEWLCHYWAIAAKSRETRISLLLMLFLELTPNWATISMKTARLHRTLLTNTVTVSSEKLIGIGLYLR